MWLIGTDPGYRPSSGPAAVQKEDEEVSRTSDDAHVDERLEVVAQRLGYRATVDEDAGLHVLLERVPGEVRARDERTRAVDDRDLRMDLPIHEGLGLLLPCE